MVQAFGYLIVWILVKDVLTLCTLPANLQDSVWVDSDKGDVVFNTTHVTGLKVTIQGSTDIQEWECFHNETGTHTNLILKSTVPFTYLASTYRPFLCLRLTAITQYSYYYYIHAPEQDNANKERVNIIFENDVASITNPESDICTLPSAPSDTTDNEYHVLVKKGNENDTIQTCPSDYFGTYRYSVTDSSTGTTTCGTGNERWDVCADRQRMTFNYTLCSTPIAYSAGGSVFCVVSLVSGSYVLHTVYNEDTTVDNSNTYRFTCVISSVAADGSVTASLTPKSCTKAQTPTGQPTLPNGTIVGLNVALTPIVLCPITSPEEASSSSNTTAIIGGTVGGIVFIALLVLILCLCLRFRPCSGLCKRKTHGDENTNKNQIKEMNKENTQNEGNKKEHGEVREHVDYCEFERENNDLKESAPIVERSINGSVHVDKSMNDIFTGTRHPAPVPIDIEQLPHVRQPHWIHGPCGEPPKGTHYHKNNKIQPHQVSKESKADTLITVDDCETSDNKKPIDISCKVPNGILSLRPKSQAMTKNEKCLSKNGVLDGPDIHKTLINMETDQTTADMDKANNNKTGKSIADTLKEQDDNRPLSSVPSSPDITLAAERLETVLNLAEFIDRGDTPVPTPSIHPSRASLRSSKTLSINNVDASVSSSFVATSIDVDQEHMVKSIDKSETKQISKTKTHNTVPKSDRSTKSNSNLNKSTKSVHFKETIIQEGENSFHGNAIEILQKSASSLSLRNKTGTFIFETETPNNQDTTDDNQSNHGTAYDDDCQYEMERGYTGIVDDVPENVEWKYGIAPTGEKHNAKSTDCEEEQSDSSQEDTVEEDEDLDQPDIKRARFSVKDREDSMEYNGLDDDRVDTAMSIIYTNSNNDPDEMIVSYDGSLTPIVE